MNNEKQQKRRPTIEELQEKFGIGKTINPKAHFLRQNGWTDYYHHDNWVKEEWFNQGLNVALMGLPLDVAYSRAYNETYGGN
jgi:hypothetical protein